MILVTGATGYIGRHVVATLIAQGARVRCLVAESQTVPDDWSGWVEVVRGHGLDEEVLYQAVTGVHTIIHLESAQWWGRLRDLERVDLEMTRGLIAAARAARVGRIIIVSHLGASPAAAYPLLRVKGMQENLIRSSGLAYTIIRSGVVFGEEDVFINHIAMMLRVTPLIFLMPGQGEVVLHPIHIDDLVQVIYQALEAMDTLDNTIEVGGAEYSTLEDLVRTVMRVTGIYRLIIPIPPYALRWLVSFYTWVTPRSLVTPQWLDILATNRTASLSNAIHYFQVYPRRLEDTLLTYMPGKHYALAALRYTFRRRPRGF